MVRRAHSVDLARVESLAGIRDPKERLRAVADALDDLQRSHGEISRLRAATMLELSRAGMSLSEIGKAAGLTRGRVSQILGPAAAEGAARRRSG